MGCSPTALNSAARIPETGWKIRFLNTSAPTVGMMKNGDINSTRTIPRPRKSLASSSAEISTPNTTLISNTLPTSTRVFQAPGRKPESVTK